MVVNSFERMDRGRERGVLSEMRGEGRSVGGR